MISGLYKAAQGMLYEQFRLDVVANNLANANSVGYKKDRVGFNMTLNTDQIDPNQKIILTSGVYGQDREPPVLMLTRYRMDLSEGAFRETGNKLDFAIKGSGFFSFETPDGTRYTRNGQFTMNANGEIVTQSGNRVLGQNGAIVIPAGKDFQVSEKGEILVGGQVIDRFQIVDFPPTGGLSKEGNGAIIASANIRALPANVQVMQGYLEDSNVDIVKEMVQMIEALRNYEGYQKTLQAIQDTIQNLNEFAKA